MIFFKNYRFQIMWALGVCAVLLALYRLQEKPIITKSPPPIELPSALYQEFTLQGKVPVSTWYRDDSYPPSTPIIFTQEEVNINLGKVTRQEQNYYGATDSYLYEALAKYQRVSMRDEFLRSKKVAVIGSITPWYESVVLFYGGMPTTIEYNTIDNQDPRLQVLTVEEFNKNPMVFDAIISISSIEHDGLGRYGDPIDPNGDLKAMKKLKTMLKEDGLLFLSVPVSKDHLWWNVHRIYGRERFPLLIEGWELIDSFGFQESDLDCDRGMPACGHQPVFVLKNVKT